MRRINIFKLLILAFFIFITSCEEGNECVSASDFGQEGSKIQVEGNDKTEYYKSSIGVGNLKKIETSSSTSTNLALDGSGVLKFSITGAWAPFNDHVMKNNNCDSKYNFVDGLNPYYGKVCKLGEDFEIADINYLKFSNPAIKLLKNKKNKCKDKDINPCWRINGLGVYLVFYQKNNPDSKLYTHIYHNNNITQNKDGEFIFTYKLGDTVKTFFQPVAKTGSRSDLRDIYIDTLVYDNAYMDNITGCLRRESNGSEVEYYPKSNQSLKIYTENGGKNIRQCSTDMTIKFSHGYRSLETGMLHQAGQLFKNLMNDVIEKMYKAFVMSPQFQNLLTITWTLFFIFFAIGFFTGFLDIKKHDIIMVTIRMGLIYALLSPNSWMFFSEYVVGFFNGVLNATTHMVIDSYYGSLEGTSISKKIGSMDVRVIQLAHDGIDISILNNADNLLKTFTSKGLNNKIWALLFSDPLGWLYIPIIYVVFYIFILAFIKLLVSIIYIIVALTMLLSLAPIFFILAIFKYTREKYFQKWLQVTVGVAIQPMILYFFMTIFLVVILDHMKTMFHYKACISKQHFSIFWLYFYNVTEVLYWFDPNASPEKKALYNIITGNGANEIDYPPKIDDKRLDQGFSQKYYSPNNSLDPLDESKKVDVTTVSFSNMLILFAIAYLMKYLIDKAQSIADKLSGGIALGQATGAVNKIINKGDEIAQKGGEALAKGMGKRTLGNAAVGIANSRLVPGALARHVKGSNSHTYNKAKRKLTKDLMKKGYSDAQIKDQMKSGALQSKIKDQMIKEKAKQLRYGTRSIMPLNIIKGAYNQYKDDKLIDSKKTKKDKKAAKNSALSGAVAKVKERQGEKLSKKADDLFAKKFAGRHDDKDLAQQAGKEKSEKEGDVSAKQQKRAFESSYKDTLKDRGYNDQAIKRILNQDRTKFKDKNEGGGDDESKQAQALNKATVQGGGGDDAARNAGALEQNTDTGKSGGGGDDDAKQAKDIQAGTSQEGIVAGTEKEHEAASKIQKAFKNKKGDGDSSGGDE
jgi:type IV secretory pathway VirB6-like protein